jgi:hypothetical protein
MARQGKSLKTRLINKQKYNNYIKILFQDFGVADGV